jgi:Protein kinase domain
LPQTTPLKDDTLSQLKAGKLIGCKQLKLACGLTDFPPEIFELAETLEILDLSGNELCDLPSDLHRLKKLRIIFCSNNQFSHLPEVLGQCENLSMIGFKANKINHIPEIAIPTRTLRWFIVTDNALKKVPNALGECAKLQKLMLAGNQLTTLPTRMANCQELELLRISANKFEALPDFLFDLPKLTWLAYAGNPFCNAIEDSLISQHQINHIDWENLTIKQILGQGASGITYQAIWQHQGKQEPVAVKLFKGGLTSDGLPRCEMHANMLAGEHPNLVGVKGVIRNHPKGVLGLVMPLLNADLKVLANPPSFDTCSRDVYASDLNLTPQQAQFILTGINQAAEHLHAKGLMHGDLYAHNILWSADKVVLSDLGGASFLPLDNPHLTQELLKLEGRALAVLLEELKSVAK